MRKLLRANLYKLRKETSVMVLVIISAALSLLVILLNRRSEFVHAEYLYLSSMQLASNLGIMFAIGVSIYIGKEFSQNTIRNKITIGFSRTQVYLANLIMSALITLLIFSAYQLFIFGLAVPIMGWNVEFVLADFIRQILNSLMILLSFSSVLNMVSMLSRSLLTSILFNILGLFITLMLFGLLMSIPVPQLVKDIVEFFIKATFLGQSLMLGSTNTITFMLWVQISGVITIALTTLLGCLIFEKLDIK